MRVVLEQGTGKHSPCWATWEIVPGYKQGGVSLLLENLTWGKKRTRLMSFKAREDFPTRQDPLSQRLYLLPWEFLHPAHFCSWFKEQLLKSHLSVYFKTWTAVKEMGFLKRRWFRERNQSMAYLAFHIQDELSIAACSGEQKGLSEREIGFVIPNC